jgi:anti-sigma factor RsiW
MKCSDCVVLIARKLDGTLTPTEARQLDAHLARCGRCCAEMLLQKRILHALKQELPGDLPDDFTRRVTGRAARLAGGERRRWFRLSSLLPAVPALAAALLLVFFWRDLAIILAPAMEAFANATGGPLADLSESVAETLAASSSVTDTGLPGSEAMSRVFANLYVSAGIAGAAVVWAFSRAYRFVR